MEGGREEENLQFVKLKGPQVVHSVKFCLYLDLTQLVLQGTFISTSSLYSNMELQRGCTYPLKPQQWAHLLPVTGSAGSSSLADLSVSGLLPGGEDVCLQINLNQIHLWALCSSGSWPLDQERESLCSHLCHLQLLGWRAIPEFLIWFSRSSVLDPCVSMKQWIKLLYIFGFWIVFAMAKKKAVKTKAQTFSAMQMFQCKQPLLLLSVFPP